MTKNQLQKLPMADYDKNLYDVYMASDVHLYTDVEQFNRCAKIVDHMTYNNKTSYCKLGYLTVMYPIYLVFGATRRYFYTELLKQIKSNSWKTEYKMF